MARAALNPHRAHGAKALVAVVAVPLAFAFLLLVFAWPAARLKPRELPIGIAGPASATQPIEQRLGPGDSFAIRHYIDERSARKAIEDREVYGAVVASKTGLSVLTASAASPLVARMLGQALVRPGAGGPSATDVVPAPEEDALGSVFSSLILPLVVCGLLLAVLVAQAQRAGSRQLGVLLAAAAGAALIGVALIQGWLGALDGHWLVNAGVLLLTVLAISSVLVGLARSFGYAGLGLGAITFVLIGNAWSAVSSAPELLPGPVGLVGQLLPPGAGASLLRSTAFFNGAGWEMPLVVLLAWIATGLVAMYAGGLVHARRSDGRRPSPVTARTTEGVARVHS